MARRVAPSYNKSSEAAETTVQDFSGDGSFNRVLDDAAGRLTHKLGPVLKAMRIFGMYCGETSFNCLPSCQGPRFYGAIYCSVAVAIMWALFFVMTVSLFYDDVSKLVKFLHILQMSLWLLICAASASVCLYVLPVGRKKTSPFEKFLRHIVSNHGNVNFSQKSTKTLVVAALFVIAFNMIVVFLSSVLGVKYVLFEPWSDLPVFDKVCPFLVMFSSGAWIYPIILLCSVCSLLVDAFDDLETRVALAIKERTLDIDELRKEHKKLCQLVEHADKAFASLLLAKLGGHVPLLAMMCYKLAKFGSITSDTFPFFIASVVWCISSITIVLVILIHASKVNDKIHRVGKILPQSYSPTGDTKESCELLVFLHHLQDEPLGLTVGGFAVITKSFSLAVLGALVSYVTFLLSLPQ